MKKAHRRGWRKTSAAGVSQPAEPPCMLDRLLEGESVAQAPETPQHTGNSSSSPWVGIALVGFVLVIIFSGIARAIGGWVVNYYHTVLK